MDRAASSISARFETGVLDPILSGRRRVSEPAPWWLAPCVVLVAGAIYGGTMGSWRMDTPERSLLVVYAAIKVPLLILATTCVCLPGYFVLSTVLGLRGEFRAALGAITSGQAGVTLALASLAPVTRFVYVCGVEHNGALLLSAGLFALSTLVGYAVMLRRYRPLLVRSRRHRLMLAAWITMYVFVGIQMGWMLRPFVGTPGMPVAFLRPEPFSNAYVAVARVIAGGVREIAEPRGRGRDGTERR